MRRVSVGYFGAKGFMDAVFAPGLRDRLQLGIGRISSEIAKVLQRQRARRPAGRIETRQLALPGIPDDGEQVTADPAGGGLEEAQGGVDRQGGVHGDILVMDGRRFYEVRGYTPGRTVPFDPRTGGYTLYAGTYGAPAKTLRVAKYWAK